MTFSEIVERLRAALPEAVVNIDEELRDPAVRVASDRVHDTCGFLRDELGMETLRLLTAIDQGDSFEMVYHLMSMREGSTIVVKATLDREAPVVQTVSDLWPAADWHEREQWDLLGVQFSGHPDLKRIMLPEDWVGHPLRKDYERPTTYHEVPTSREAVVPVTVPSPPMHLHKAEELGGLMRINMGPHHPATHGVINFLLETDGEIMKRAIPDVGYLHRGLEKLGEMNTFAGNMPYTDRVDYLGAMFTNHGWALACEKLLGIEVPRRGEFCRVIASELNRIASHLVATGALAMDVGAYTPFIHWLRERETINDFMERICGARLTYNYMRIGGVSRDITKDICDDILVWLNHFEPMCDEFDRLITGNEIFVRRLADLAQLTPQDAYAWAIVGPNLRASGIDWDLRRNEPYSVYPELEFEVPLGQGFRGVVGDCYDRFIVRLLEMRQSVRILRQAIANMPDGDTRAKVPRKLKIEKNEVYAAVEGPRGEAGFYIVTDGSESPYRVRYRTPSFSSLSVIEHLSPGLMVADLVALIGSLDIIAPEVDR